MRGNSNFSAGRASYASLENQMAAFDRLPRSVREALANAAFDWAAYPIRSRFESGRMSAKAIVQAIGQWDRKQIDKDRKKVWGISK
jgi:uncharacterized protein DUF6525